MIASKKKRSLICPTDVRLALSLKVKYTILLCQVPGLIVAEEMIFGGFSNRI